MKRILSFVIISLLAWASCFVCTEVPQKALASSESYSQTMTYQVKVLNEICAIKNREAGSEGEKLVADYIKGEMDIICQENDNFEAVNSASVVDGIQKFSFTSAISGLNAQSQNLVYYYRSNIESSKKVILACNYDSVAFDYDVLEYLTTESESVNGSAGSVATLLALSKTLPSLNLPYNVEIIFFGAGESNNAGSNHYCKGILPEVKENILCMINIDNIAVGENLYFYVDEVNTSFSNYVGDKLRNIRSDIKEIDLVHLGKVVLDYENELGLNYYHIAMTSDNINFMKEGITCLNLFAGDYEEGIVYGRSEFLGKDSITYTVNDNLEYISQNYGENHVNENLINIHNGITSILQDENFEQKCLNAQGEISLFYKIFGNQQLIAYLGMVALIIMIAIIIYIHFKLSIKSYNARVEAEFLSTVISISQNVDQECKDEAIPKAVSQVIARDIKKDKTIKEKKKDKKDS